MIGRGVLEHAVDDAGAVEPGGDREPARDGGGLEPAGLLHPPDVLLQVRAARGRRVQAAVSAPSQVAAQVGLGVLAGGAREPGQVGGHGQPYVISWQCIGCGRGEVERLVVAHHAPTMRSVLKCTRSPVRPARHSLAWRLRRRTGSNDENVGVQLSEVNPQPGPQRHRRQQIERVLRRAAYGGGERRGAVQHLGQREPGRRRIRSILARRERLRLASRGDERLGQQQLRTATLPGSGLCRRGQPGHPDRELAQHPGTLRQPGRQRGGAGSRRPGPVASPFRAISSLRHAPGWLSGTGTDIGASSSNAAWAPASRPGTSSETAVSGSVPSAIRSRPGASNAATRTSRTAPPNRYRLPPRGRPCTLIERHISRVRRADEGCPPAAEADESHDLAWVSLSWLDALMYVTIQWWG